MRVLVACEESQRVCIEFRKLGHEAFSCDIQECSGGYPEWHIKGDVIEQLNKGWDMVIGFPPCTDLTSACANLWAQKKSEGKVQKAYEFVLQIWNSCDKVAIENPQGWLNNNWRKPDQRIEPYYFGDPYKKRTELWLKNLPKLKYSLCETLFEEKTAVKPLAYWVSSSVTLRNKNALRKPKGMRGGVRDPKERSKTFPGIARAMAEQWGKLE